MKKLRLIALSPSGAVIGIITGFLSTLVSMSDVLAAYYTQKITHVCVGRCPPASAGSVNFSCDFVNQNPNTIDHEAAYQVCGSTPGVSVSARRIDNYGWENGQCGTIHIDVTCAWFSTIKLDPVPAVEDPATRRCQQGYKMCTTSSTICCLNNQQCVNENGWPRCH